KKLNSPFYFIGKSFRCTFAPFCKGYVLQKIVSILLLFAFSAQMFSQLGVLAGYELNKEYIIEKFCVNRDNPEMHCDGKCYLKKKLQQDQQRKNSENNINDRMDILLFCSEEKSPLLPVLSSSEY